MGRGRRERGSARQVLRPGKTTLAADLTLPAHFRPIDPPLDVRWRLRPVVAARAIARSHDTVLVTVECELPRPGRQAVWANVGVPQAVHWAYLSEISGLPDEPELDATSRALMQQDRGECPNPQTIREWASTAATLARGPIPPSHAFNARQVRMDDTVKMMCATLLASATIQSREQFAADLTDPLYRDLVEGGYIQPDGTFTERGITAAGRAIGEHFVQRHLDTLAARAG